MMILSFIIYIYNYIFEKTESSFYKRKLAINVLLKKKIGKKLLNIFFLPWRLRLQFPYLLGFKLKPTGYRVLSFLNQVIKLKIRIQLNEKTEKLFCIRFRTHCASFVTKNSIWSFSRRAGASASRSLIQGPVWFIIKKIDMHHHISFDMKGSEKLILRQNLILHFSIRQKLNFA